ncbi:MAG: hypothetical protein Q8L15_05655 [Methylobacter sp.]|nr:hypothetical protein [Methylobacter sp.]
MNFFRVSLFLIVSIFSGSVFADTYPAVSNRDTVLSQCQAWFASHYPDTPVTCKDATGYQGEKITGFSVTPSGAVSEYYSLYLQPYGLTCPSGGTLSGTSCINAPACVAPQVRNSLGVCAAPPPPPAPDCPNIVHGNTITKQTWNDTTQQCENSDIVYCDSQLEIPDAATGSCLPKPGAVDCGNGVVVISPVTCPVPKNHDNDITCPNGLVISPPRTCSVLPPDPSQCPPGVETTGYFNGVPTCVMKDGSKTPTSADGQAPPSNQNNPQAYQPGVACDSSYSYACDPGLPAAPKLPGVSGIEKCGPGTFFTCAQTFDAPVRPNSNTLPPVSTTTAGNSSTSTTTTTNNPNGTVTTSTTGSSTSTVTGTTSMNCPDCATESTLRYITGQLNDIKAGAGKSVNVGAGHDSFDNAVPDAAVAQAKADYQAKFTQVQNSIKSMFSFSGAGAGSLPSFDFGVIKGVHVSTDLNRYSSQLSYVGLTIMFVASFLAVRLFLE